MISGVGYSLFEVYQKNIGVLHTNMVLAIDKTCERENKPLLNRNQSYNYVYLLDSIEAIIISLMMNQG
ncbi:MAG: hypothetical protein E6Q32_01510 [Neisseriales bacterium]|nr:MAG: hypothetical protein E6Q32_01510 [Neisseriales bacterium]